MMRRFADSRILSRIFLSLPGGGKARVISPGLCFAAFTTLILSIALSESAAMTVPQKHANASDAEVHEAKLLWNQGRRWEAIAKIKAGIELAPGNAANYVELAEMYLGVARNDLARAALTDAVKANPNYGPAYQRMAAVLRMVGDFEGAIREAKLALALKPDSQTAAYSHVTIARSLDRLNRHTESAEEFQKATAVYHELLRVNPTDASAHFALGNLLFDLHRFDEAESSYRSTLEHDPRHFPAVFSLALTLQNQGKKDEAIRYYREYISLYRQTPDKAMIESRIKWLETAGLPNIFGYQLIFAAEEGYSARVKLLLEKGADVTLRAENKTALSAAASAGYMDIVKLLLAHGAKDDDGAAINGAYEAGHKEIEKVLEGAACQPLGPKVLNRLMSTAINKGDVAKFATLVKGGDVDADDLLIRVVNQKKAPPAEMVLLLLEKGARVNQPSRYKTVLMHAATEGHNEVIKLLLAKGADVNAQTDEGTALMMAVVGGHVETVKLLLAAGAGVNARHRSGNTPLIMAASASIPELNPVKGAPPPKPNAEVMKMLLASGADANARGQWEQTALMHANSAAKVQLLLARGADVEARDQDGQTALMKAASAGNAEVADAILKKANVNAADRKGATALIHALNQEGTRYGDSAPALAKGRLAVARQILLVKNVDVNAQNENGETALMRAITIGDIEIVKSLWASGADPTRADVLGNTAFVFAYEKNNTEITKLLESHAAPAQAPPALNAFLPAAIKMKDAAKVQEVLAAGANPNYEYGISYDHQGIKTTVLVEAAKAGHLGIVQMLLDKGADLTARGLISGSESGLKFGTALEAAEFSQQAEVVALLKKYLATKN